MVSVWAVPVAWGIAAAACALAAIFALRALRARRALDAERRRCGEARLSAGLAHAVLARSAVGAVRFAPSGPIVVGPLGEPLQRVLRGDGDGALGGAVRDLVQDGRPFRHTADADGTILEGMLHAGHPVVFVERAAGEPRGPAAFEGDSVSERLARLLSAGPHPAWVADGGDDLVWANRAYAEAVGVSEADALAGRSEPLLDTNARTELLGAGSEAGAAGLAPRRQRVQTVVAGERRTFDVSADERDGAVAALAVDLTEDVARLATRSRELESHAATFDRLATAIAIFGPDRRLTFYNAAFQTLWHLPSALLEQAPPEERVLDQLRADRRLPETADFKAWKRDQLRGYETREGFERWWHLPDGQTLRVIANPGPDGGVTYIYENVTEQLALERRYNALTRAQAETIDNLGEGIATFGPDGLLRLANPAFWTLTAADPAEVGTHVSAVAATAPAGEQAAWGGLIERVTGLSDHRTAADGRLERAGGQVLDYAVLPLPDGSTLATFTDVTDRVNVARALLEKNNALVEADRLKNAFIEHVSYELRSPLNTIIGFTQLLARPETGHLTERQRTYADHISTSSEALLTIIDGILDLATIDAGIMELDLGTVDVAATVRHVLDGLKDRVAEAALDIRLDVAGDAHSFEGDAQRVRQILFNLMSNAVAHSPHGGAVAITARREADTVAISVRDHGPGIAQDKMEAVFERFMTTGAQGRRGGVGLGLSLVKGFVELHGGSVAVAPVAGPGAEVVVRFPRRAARATGEARAAA